MRKRRALLMGQVPLALRVVDVAFSGPKMYLSGKLIPYFLSISSFLNVYNS